MKRGFPILAIITGLLLSFALYEALIAAPTERTMGDVQRIFYYHVPSAWTAFLLFLINFVASVQYLVRLKPSGERVAKWVVIALGLLGSIVPFFVSLPVGMRPSAAATTAIAVAAFYFLIGKYFSGDKLDILALVAAEVGVVFCTVVIVTGPLWARPIWGIWWAPGDIRLTTTLVLWLIYISYLVLRRFSTSGQTAVIAAVVAIFGALDVPLVYFSIWFFRTQHPSPVIGGGGSLDPSMWHVLLINWAAFLCLAWLVCWTRYQLEVATRQVEEAQSIQSLQEVSR
jgi:heme exporter protein C